ncbi:MAG: phosphocholine cytidylyltransferase family protein [Kofleriaceae bacterium]
MSRPRRAIIIAAGRGRRLGPHTEEVPKCMVPVGAAPILGWQWRALAAAGVEELVLIRGYRADVLTRFASELLPAVSFFDNPRWEHNNVLLSLACARAALDQPVLLSYSDILFTPAVAEAAAASDAEIGLIIDRRFRDIYVGRSEHPLDEAEVASMTADGRVAKVGKRALPAAEAAGEFIGLARLGERGVAAFAQQLDELLARYQGREEAPFQRAASFRNAYLTDLLQELIDVGDASAAPAPACDVRPIWIEGQWREIDTGQDLERARLLVDSGVKEWT